MRDQELQEQLQVLQPITFYEQNKGRTKEGKLKKWTIILGIVFVVLAIALGILYLV